MLYGISRLRVRERACVEPDPAGAVVGYRLCPDCARWRQARAFHRVFPAMQELQQQYPEDRWVLITLTAESSDDPLPVVVKRFKKWLAKLRRTHDWQRCIRGAVVGFECVYHPGQGWHFHAHILASRMAWWDQADLAASWQHVSGEMGQIVDIRAVKDLQKGVAETLKYVMKPTNLLDWGPGQVAQFNALGRTKLRECYGAMRGLVGEIDGDGEDQLAMEPEEIPLAEGESCPECGAELTARWLLREELYGRKQPPDEGGDSHERFTRADRWADPDRPAAIGWW